MEPHTADAIRPALLRCLSLDLEVGLRDGRIHKIAGVRPDTDESLTLRAASRTLNAALASLDRLADGADFLLGHNLIAFDLPHLRAASPGLRLLRLPAVDTLRLNPLAFPRNPYHHLVKHYQDGQLKRGRINDPELDARSLAEKSLAGFRATISRRITVLYGITVYVMRCKTPLLHR